MSAVKVSIVREEGNDDIPLPSYQTADASGMDVHAAVKDATYLPAGETMLIPTGFRVAIPPGYEIQVRPRSGLALKHGIAVLNSPGTIDADYRGPVGIILHNFGKSAFIVKRGDRIAQMILCPVVRAEMEITDELPGTARGEGGFGSSGV